MKKLQWILWAWVYLLYFDGYVFDDVKINLSTNGLKNIYLIACIRTDHRHYRALQISTMEFIFKNSNVCMFLACTSAGGYNAALKIQAEISLLQHILWIPLDGCIWSMKIILWDTSYFRHSNNTCTTKGSLQQLLMKLR